jgi:hypothetical protein
MQFGNFSLFLGSANSRKRSNSVIRRCLLNVRITSESGRIADIGGCRRVTLAVLQDRPALCQSGEVRGGPRAFPQGSTLHAGAVSRIADVSPRQD